MGTYRIGADGHLTEYQPEVLSDEHCEKEFKDWLEQNPQMLIEGEKVLWIGREVATELGKSVDLLGLDKRGQVLSVEVKAGTSPRTVIAQALEYGVWADGLDREALSRIAQSYWDKKKGELDWLPAGAHDVAPDLSEGFEAYFGQEREIPARQTVVYVVAQRIAEDVQQVAEWLRGHDIDIRCLKFTYHEGPAPNECLLTTELVVGRVPLKPGKLTRETFLNLFQVERVRETIEGLLKALESVTSEYPGQQVCWLEYGTGSVSFKIRWGDGKSASVLYIASWEIVGTPSYMIEHRLPEELWEGFRDLLYDYKQPSPWVPKPLAQDEPKIYGHSLDLQPELVESQRERIVEACEWLAQRISEL